MRKAVYFVAVWISLSLVYRFWNTERQPSARIGKWEIRINQNWQLPAFFFRAIAKFPSALSDRILSLDKPDSMVFQVLQSGRPIFKRTSRNFNFVTVAPGRPLVQDLNGNGLPDVAVQEYSGGAHCCFALYLLEADSKECLKFFKIDGRHGEIEMHDLDRDGIVELTLQDWSFAYWPGSFAASPAPRVVLQWRDGDYRVAAELMAKLPPPEDDLLLLADQINGSEWWKSGIIPNELFSTALDLMYSGHDSLAWTFMCQSWNHQVPMNPYFEELLARLAKSPYWKDLNWALTAMDIARGKD